MKSIKKLVLALSATVCLWGYVSPALADEQLYEPPKFAIIVSPKPTIQSIYVRVEPNFSSKPVGTISISSDPIKVLAESKQKERLLWYKVKLPNGKEGWMYGQYIQFSSSAQTGSNTSDLSSPASTETPVSTNEETFEKSSSTDEVSSSTLPATTSGHEAPLDRSTLKERNTQIIPVVDSEGNPTNSVSLDSNDPAAPPPMIQEVPTPSPPTGSRTISPTPEQSNISAHDPSPPVFLDLTDNPRHAKVENKNVPFLNLPGPSGAAIKILLPGHELQITGIARIKNKAQPHPWYRVIDKEVGEGWVYGEYITVSLTERAVPAANINLTIRTEDYPQIGRITANQLLIRSAPTRQADLLGGRKKNDVIELLGETISSEGKWYHVAIDERHTGWMLARHIAITDQPITQREGSASSDISSTAPSSNSLALTETTDPHAQPEKTSSPPTVRLAHITRSGVNIRQHPLTTAPVISKSTHQQSITIVGEQNTNEVHLWYQLQEPAGWIYGQFVKIIETPSEAEKSPLDEGTGETLPIQSSHVVSQEIPSSSMASSTEQPITQQAIVTKRSVNVRQEPSIEASVVSTVKQNQAIRLIAEQKTNEAYSWYRIDSPAGWIYGQWVTLEDQAGNADLPQEQNTPLLSSKAEEAREITSLPNAETSSIPPARRAIVTRQGVNVREKAATTARPISKVDRQQKVTVIAEQQTGDAYSWYQLESPAGWIYGQYLAFEKQQPPSTLPSTETESAIPVILHQPDQSVQKAEEAPLEIKESASPESRTLSPAKQATVTRDSINIREQPSTSAAIIAKAKRNEKITLIAEHTLSNEKYPWYRLETPNGWIYGQFVKVIDTSPETIDPSSADKTEQNDQSEKKPPADLTPAPIIGNAIIPMKQATVTRQSIHVREQPSTSAAIVSRINRNQPINIVAEHQANEAYPWYRIESPAGWVYGQLIKFKETTSLHLQNEIVELFPIPKTAHLKGQVILRETHSGSARPIAYLNMHDTKAIDIIGQWQGKEPYFWYQIQHPTHGICWVYGQHVRFVDETTRFPQIHLLMLDIDEQYGPHVNEIIRKLGNPEKSVQTTGKLVPLNTNYVNTQLTYPGLSLRFLRYFDEDHLFELDVSSETYSVGNLMIGMYKTDIMLQLGEGKIIKNPQGETLIYSDPITQRMRMALTFDKEERLIHIKKIAWIE